MKILKILYSEDEGGVLQAESQYMHELSKTGVEIFSIIVNMLSKHPSNDRHPYRS